MTTNITNNDYIDLIKSIADGLTLTSQQTQKMTRLVMALNSSTDFNRRLIGTLTRHALEHSSFTLSGDITFTGKQNFTGSVDLSGYVQSNELNIVVSDIDNKFLQVNGAVDKNITSNSVDVAISGTSLGAVKSLISVPQNVGTSYSLNFTGDTAFLNGTVYKFTILNQPSSSSNASTASSFTLESQGPTQFEDFTAVSSTGTNGFGVTAMQEITVIKLNNTITAYSNTTYMTSLV